MTFWNWTLKLLHDNQTTLPQKLNEKYYGIPDSWNRKQRTGLELPGNNESRKRFQRNFWLVKNHRGGKKKRKITNPGSAFLKD